MGCELSPPEEGSVEVRGVARRHSTGIPYSSSTACSWRPSERSRVATIVSTPSRPHLGSPLMGSIGTRFGRNVPLDQTLRESEAQLLDPNPRTISRELLTRERFLDPLPAHDSRSSEPR